MEQIRDTVWWRRVTYFAFVLATLVLVVFPAAGKRFASALFDKLNVLNQALGGRAEATSDGINDTLKGIVLPWKGALLNIAPGWAKDWVEAFCELPFGMLVAIGIVASLFLLGQLLQQRVHDRAWFAWHADRRDDYVNWVRDSAKRSTFKATLLLGALLALLLVCAAWQEWADVSALLKLLVVAALAVLLWRMGIQRRLRNISAGHVPSTPTLKLANLLRKDRLLIGAAWLVGRILVPLLFASTLLWLILGGVGHFAMRSADSAGAFCKPSAGAQTMGDQAVTLKMPFDTKSFCWSTGIKVEKDKSYDVLLETNGTPPWRDNEGPASMSGIKAWGPAHYFFAPVKRAWDIDYFVPMLRVGQLGNDEKSFKAHSTTDGCNKATLRFKATHDGELFLYVSDAIFFYGNNQGTAAVTVVPTPVAPTASAAGETCQHPS